MRHAFRAGRIGGIEIAVHWTVPVVAVLVMSGLYTVVLPAAVAAAGAEAYARTAVELTVLMLAALSAHALGYVLVARHCGVPVRRVTIWPLGGWAEPADGAPVRTGLLVAVAGPAVNLLLSGGSEVAAGSAKSLGLPALTVAALTWFSTVNVGLALVNVLPGAPMDGGRLLSSVGRSRRPDAARAGVILGCVFGAVGLAWALGGEASRGRWLVLLGAVIAVAADDVRTARAPVGST